MYTSFEDYLSSLDITISVNELNKDMGSIVLEGSYKEDSEYIDVNLR